jgi:hypothetical protein
VNPNTPHSSENNTASDDLSESSITPFENESMAQSVLYLFVYLNLKYNHTQQVVQMMKGLVKKKSYQSNIGEQTDSTWKNF